MRAPGTAWLILGAVVATATAFPDPHVYQPVSRRRPPLPPPPQPPVRPMGPRGPQQDLNQGPSRTMGAGYISGYQQNSVLPRNQGLAPNPRNLIHPQNAAVPQNYRSPQGARYPINSGLSPRAFPQGSGYAQNPGVPPGGGRSPQYPWFPQNPPHSRSTG